MQHLQSHYHSVRVAAASQLSLLFKHVAEMQEQAIDNILDLCEDSEALVCVKLSIDCIIIHEGLKYW